MAEQKQSIYKPFTRGQHLTVSASRSSGTNSCREKSDNQLDSSSRTEYAASSTITDSVVSDDHVDITESDIVCQRSVKPADDEDSDDEACVF